MPQRVTENRLLEFTAELQALGGSAGNKSLREALEWDEEFYWKVQGRLVEEQVIVPGRGKGGSVRLKDVARIEDDDAGQTNGIDYPNERALYEPLSTAIDKKWINRFGFDNHAVEETHSQGSKRTGGTFTRPDITVVGVRRYEFLPKRIEIVSFEVKPETSVDVMGVLEALAHREAAHRSYVFYNISKSSFEASKEAERIIELSQKYGVGVVIVDDPTQVETWEILLDAQPNDPDPARLDRFLSDLPSATLKRQIHKWKD